MKTAAFAIVMLLSVMFTGCVTSVSAPTTSGIFAGKALYLVYTRNIDKQPGEVKVKIDELWDEINEVKDISDLAVVSALVNSRFDAILADSKLVPSDKEILVMIKNEICSKIDEVINSKLTSNQEGIKFLVGVRIGVNSMIEAYANK